MRLITTHHIPDVPPLIRIEVVGSGAGASVSAHDTDEKAKPEAYQLFSRIPGGLWEKNGEPIRFRKGNQDTLTNEALLAVLVDRLQYADGYDSGLVQITPMQFAMAMHTLKECVKSWSTPKPAAPLAAEVPVVIEPAKPKARKGKKS